jgi:hypothetical protein
MTPLGVRGNNPGNIDAGPVPWQGQIGVAGRFAVFDTPINGIRALAKNLIAYQDKHDLHTVRGIINRWAPNVENDTSSYVSAVSHDMQVAPDDAIDLHTASTLIALCAAIIRHENGEQPYGQAVLSAAVADALA